MIPIAVLGFDSGPLRSLSIALANRGKGVCAIADWGQAQVGLVDIDQITEARQWRKVQRTNQAVLIAVCSNGKIPETYSKDFVFSISKPLRITELIKAVCKAAETKSDAVTEGDIRRVAEIDKVGDAAQLIKDGPKTHLSKLFKDQEVVDPDQYLLGAVMANLERPTKKTKRFRKLQWLNQQWVLLDYDSGQAFHNIKQKVLRHAAITSLQGGRIRAKWIDKEQFEELKKEIQQECEIEKFIWMLTYYTIRSGRQKGLDIQRIYRLKCWPNLTRYSTGESDIPLANYWIDKPCSIASLAESLDIDPEITLPFAACCYNCGFLEEVGEETSAGVEKKRPRLRKVLSMILGKMSH